MGAGVRGQLSGDSGQMTGSQRTEARGQTEDGEVEVRDPRSKTGTAGLRISRISRIRAGSIPVQTAFLGGFAAWRETARDLGCFC